MNIPLISSRSKLRLLPHSLVVCLVGAALAGLVLAPSPASASVGVVLNGSALEVTGDSSNDLIVIRCHEGVIRLNTVPQSIPCDDVATLAVNAGAGDDLINISGLFYGNITLTSDVIHAGTGADHIVGSWFKDNIFGDGGSDVISSDQSDNGDDVDGGPGTDTIVAGPGDSLWLTDSLLNQNQGKVSLVSVEAAIATGNDGADVYDGAGFSGKLTFQGNGGDDHLIGGSGDDTLIGSDGNDTIDAGAGRDLMSAGKGTDICNGGKGNDVRLSCERGSP